MTQDSPLTAIPGVGESTAKKLAKLNLFTVSDLLNHFPRKYLDLSHPQPIATLTDEGFYCFKACLIKFNNFRYHRGFLQTAIIGDDKGKLPVIWFNQPYLKDSLKVGEWYYFSGPIKLQKNKLTLISPDSEVVKETQLNANRIIPIYPETAGVSSKALRRLIFFCLNALSLTEILPSPIITDNHFLSYDQTLHQIHFPDTQELEQQAKTRLAFNDLLSIYLKSALTKKSWAQHDAPQIKFDTQLHRRLIKSLPYQLTPDQKTALKNIFSDLNQTIPMNRLLQGDVGSGKTIVAAAAALQSIKAGFQTIIMAPTQVLAQQHFVNLSQLLSPFKIKPTLVTSAAKKRPDSLLLIGTHALLKSQSLIRHPGLLIIDEQHRFGVLQRSQFLKNQLIPHVLTMTATPIPRTIALSFYGHLDISFIKTLPRGRQKVKTWVVPETKRDSAYTWLKKRLQLHQQAFIVCPFIETSTNDTLKNVRAATQEFDRLKTIFKGFRLDLLHGRLKPTQKDGVLDRFRQGQSDILVTTPVIEVGVDIPNATIIIIEGAERFGLSSLHQLRGRVGRGSQSAYCLLFPTDESSENIARIKLLEKHHSGLTLAKYDLKLRGAGDIFGTLQSGHLDTNFKAFWDKDLRTLAQQTAHSIAQKSTTKATSILQNLSPQVAKISTSN